MTNAGAHPMLLKVAEAAVLLGCADTPRQVYAMSAQFPPGVVVKIGRRLRFSKPALEAWLREQGALPESGPWAGPKTEDPRPGPISKLVQCPECGCKVMWVPNEAAENAP